MKPAICYGIILVVGLVVTPVMAKEKPKKIDYKKVCKETKAELKPLKKELAALQEKRTAINQKLTGLNSEWDGYRRQLERYSRCSQGNPNNSSQCNRLLDEIRRVGNEITELKKQLGPITKRNIEIQNQMYTPEHRLKTYRCE